jgi:hypothetical protein
MTDTSQLRRGNGGADRDQVHRAKLFRLGRAGVRNTDQVHERMGACDPMPISGAVERVTGDDLNAGRQLAFGSRAGQGAYRVTPSQQIAYNRASHVSCGSCNEDSGHSSEYTGGITRRMTLQWQIY